MKSQAQTHRQRQYNNRHTCPVFTVCEHCTKCILFIAK